MDNGTAFNSTNATDSPPLEHSSLSKEDIVHISLQTTIAFLGVIGNILVCMAILRKSKMKSVMNYYLLSLSLSDLGILSISFPIAIIRVFGGNIWILGEVGCIVLFPVSDVFFGACIWSIKAIAIERYRNIVGSGRFSRERSTKPVKIIIPLIWAASFLVTSVPMFIVVKYYPETRYCHLNWPKDAGWHVAYFVALSVLWYVIPLLVIIVTYARISRKLQQSQAFQQSLKHSEELDADPKKGPQRNFSSTRSSRARMHDQNSKAKGILTPLVVLFAVTMLPLSTLRIGQFFWTHVTPESEHYTLIVMIYGVIMNSSLNPVIYYIVSKDFRESFKDIFNCICRK